MLEPEKLAYHLAIWHLDASKPTRLDFSILSLRAGRSAKAILVLTCNLKLPVELKITC